MTTPLNLFYFSSCMLNYHVLVVWSLFYLAQAYFRQFATEIKNIWKNFLMTGKKNVYWRLEKEYNFMLWRWIRFWSWNRSGNHWSRESNFKSFENLRVSVYQKCMPLRWALNSIWIKGAILSESRGTIWIFGSYEEAHMYFRCWTLSLKKIRLTSAGSQKTLENRDELLYQNLILEWQRMFEKSDVKKDKQTLIHQAIQEYFIFKIRFHFLLDSDWNLTCFEG